MYNFAVRSTVNNMFVSTLPSNARNGALKRGDNEAYTSVYLGEGKKKFFTLSLYFLIQQKFTIYFLKLLVKPE